MDEVIKVKMSYRGGKHKLKFRYTIQRLDGRVWLAVDRLEDKTMGHYESREKARDAVREMNRLAAVEAAQAVA